MKKYGHATTVIIIAIAVSFVYFSPFINNFFSYDSFRYIENIFSGPKAVMVGYNAFRVVSNFMWYPLYYFSGLDPSGYNIFNYSLFGINSFLLYLVTARLWGEKELSFLIATLFVLNVTATDAVFWQMSLSTLLCAFFYLLALLSYISFRQSGNRYCWHSTILIYIVAMFTKEDAASFPLVVVLIEVFFFGGLDNIKSTLKKVLPLCLVIAGYIIISNTVFYFLGVVPETAKFFKIRPLYSIFAGYSAFFLHPKGVLNLSNPYIYVTAVAVVGSLFLIKNKKLLIFGYLWIFVTFLPQSLSAIGQFEQKYIFNSISRLLYLPVVGVSIVFALLLMQLKAMLPMRAGYCLVVVFLGLFLNFNYSRVQERGTEWRNEAEPVRVFLTELKKKVPQFPPNTDFFAINGPTGRAYMQQSLRAFYGNPTMTWIVDPTTYIQKPGRTAILFDVKWSGPQSIYAIDIVQFSLAELYLRMR